MKKFRLVNPVITGTFNTTYEASNSDEAAKMFWKTLTEEKKYITGNVPKFLFTLMDETGNLFHYMVKEKAEGSYADYTIEKVDVKLSDEEEKKFLEEVEKVQKNNEKLEEKETEQAGGKRRKRYDDSSSSSSDSDDDIDELFKYIRLKKANRPISYWWYTPGLYNTDSVFTPTFVAPISPYVQLWNLWAPMR